MNREFVVPLLGTVGGSLIVGFLISLAHLHPYLATAGAVGAVILVVLVVNYQDSVAAMVLSPGRYRIAGAWNTIWSYRKGDDHIHVGGVFKITQIGRYFWAAGQSTEIRTTGHERPPFDALEFKLRGRVTPDGIAQGEWQNLNVGMNYYGTFQAKIHSGGRKFEGVWVGVENQGVRSGTLICEKA